MMEIRPKRLTSVLVRLFIGMIVDKFDDTHNHLIVYKRLPCLESLTNSAIEERKTTILLCQSITVDTRSLSPEEW